MAVVGFIQPSTVKLSTAVIASEALAVPVPPKLSDWLNDEHALLELIDPVNVTGKPEHTVDAEVIKSEVCAWALETKSKRENAKILAVLVTTIKCSKITSEIFNFLPIINNF